MLTKESQTHSALLFDTDCRLQKEFQKMFFFFLVFFQPLKTSVVEKNKDAEL